MVNGGDVKGLYLLVFIYIKYQCSAIINVSIGKCARTEFITGKFNINILILFTTAHTTNIYIWYMWTVPLKMESKFINIYLLVKSFHLLTIQPT